MTDVARRLPLESSEPYIIELRDSLLMTAGAISGDRQTHNVLFCKCEIRRIITLFEGRAYCSFSRGKEQRVNGSKASAKGRVETAARSRSRSRRRGSDLGCLKEGAVLGLAVDTGTIRKWCHLVRPSPKGRTRREEPYAKGGLEPRLEDLLNDPVTQALLRCDGVSSKALSSLIDDARAGLKSRQFRM